MWWTTLCSSYCASQYFPWSAWNFQRPPMFGNSTCQFSAYAWYCPLLRRATLNFSSLMPIFSPSGNCFWTSRTLFHGIFLAWSVCRTLDINTRMWLMPSTLGNKLKGRQVHFFGLGDRSASRWGSALHWIGLYPWKWHCLMRSWGEYQRYIDRVKSSSCFGPNLFRDEVYQSSVVWGRRKDEPQAQWVS